jgi:hypothetical protein
MEMKFLLGFVVLVGCLVTFLFLRANSRRQAPAMIGSYADIKKAIRNSTANTDVVVPQSAAKPSITTEQAFQLQDENEFLAALLEGINYRASTQGLASLNASQVAVMTIWELEGEVNNGGFDQYFFNSAGSQARQAVSSLELIGAGKAADIVKRAVALFGQAGPSENRGLRQDQLEKLSDADRKKLAELDSEFFDYPDPISDLLAKYCRAHRADF